MSTNLAGGAADPVQLAGGPSPRLRRLRLVLRCAAAVACFGLALAAGAVLAYLIQDKKNFGKGIIHILPHNDAVKAAITQQTDSAKSLFQASLLAFAALWAMILVKKDERRLALTDLPELVMFLLANFCFVVSWLSHFEYMEAMVKVQSEAQPVYNRFARGIPDAQGNKSEVGPGVMDFRDHHISNFSDWQKYCLVFGVAAAGLTLLSAHLFKESP